MPSFVTVSNRNDMPSDVKVFDVWNYSSISEIEVTLYKPGIFSIYLPVGAEIHEFLEFISGIFSEDSNFSLYVCGEFGVPKESFKGVRADFNGVIITATKYSCDPKKMFDKWYAEQKILLKKDKKRGW